MKVYEKSAEQYNREQGEANIYAHMVRGVPKEVCEYYVVTKEGKKIDVSDLTEEQVLAFCKQALVAWGKAKDEDSKDVAEAFKLVQAVRPYFRGTYKGLNTVMDLLENKDGQMRSSAADLFTPLYVDKIQNVNAVAKYLQECKGNFKSPTSEQIKEVANQMAKNEANKNKERTR